MSKNWQDNNKLLFVTIQNQAAAAISCNQQMQATTQQRMQRYEKQVSLVTFLLHKTKAQIPRHVLLLRVLFKYFIPTFVQWFT